MNVVCVGDCGVDRYLAGSGDDESTSHRDRPGGITLNFAVHAARLFSTDDRVAVVSALGTDDEATLVADAVNELALEAHLVELPGRTSIQYIDLESSGEKIFVRYEQGVLGEYRVGERERALIAEADLLMAPHYRQIDRFFESVMLSPSRGLRAVDFADIADDPVITNVERYLDYFDVAFFGLTRAHGELIECVRELSSRSGKLFVVTLAAEGSQAFRGSNTFLCPAAAVSRVVDTTGAGDTFAAGFLSEYVHSGDIETSLGRGAAEAAETIQRIGAF